MLFNNIYYKRTTATAKACYVCYKPTTTVLATINTTDFLYTCPGHLSDHGFASTLGGEDGADGARKVVLSDEEIAKVKEEWEEKQKRKKEKEKEDKEKKEKDGEKDKGKDKEDTKKDGSKSPPMSGSLTAKTPPAPVHERYALHRDFFAMRQGEHRKRRQAAQAKDLAPRLPFAPRGAVDQDKY
ncbi:hypothetical protein DXG01_007221 [Tephrocybe rancida]|nr:hypothetical protein DXG01_007221 [Tephrocybe rancida]